MNNLKTAVLLAAMSGLLIAIGGSLGGSSGAVTALVVAAVMNFGSYWFSADIVLRTAGAHEIQRANDPALFALIEGVAHVKNRDILTSSVVATIASAISMLAWMGMWFGGGDRRNNGANLIAVIVAPIAATLIQLAVSRAREFEADHDGAEIVRDPEALASALAKLEMGSRRITMDVPQSTAHMYIVNPFAGLRGANLFATHPPTEERIARLRRMAM